MGQKKISKDNQSLKDGLIGFFSFLPGIIIAFLPWFVSVNYWDSIENFIVCSAWRLNQIHIPSNTIYYILPYDPPFSISNSCCVLMLDAIVVGSVLCFLYILGLLALVPKFRPVETKSGKHSKSNKENKRFFLSGIVIFACILAAMNIYTIYSIRHKGGTFICVTGQGVYTENSHTNKKHNYTWDDVMTVKWDKHWSRGRHNLRPYFYFYCVGMRDGSVVHLGEEETVADYIAFRSRVTMTKAKTPCPVCGSDYKPLWADD